MNERIKCAEIVSGVVKDATVGFSSAYTLVNERFDILKQYCDFIDLIFDETDGLGFEVSIDNFSKEICIKIIARDIFIEMRKEDLIELSKRANSMEFSREDDDMIGMSFVFPSMWERV